VSAIKCFNGHKQWFSGKITDGIAEKCFHHFYHIFYFFESFLIFFNLFWSFLIFVLSLSLSDVQWDNVIGEYYRLIHKYMRQPRTQSSRLRVSGDYLHRIDLLGLQTDQIGFNSAIDSIIILSSYTFKYVQIRSNTFKCAQISANTLTRGSGWSMIREWSSDFSIMRKPMFTTLHRNFGHSLLEIFIHFEQSNSGLATYVAVVKTSMMKIVCEKSSGWFWCENSGYTKQIFFVLAQSITETFRVSLVIVLMRLHNFIGFRSFHLQWVPHVLIVELREKRMEYTQAMLPFLYAVGRDGWYHLVTGDESWFYLDTSPRRM
jgi:hypothetical protein